MFLKVGLWTQVTSPITCYLQQLTIMSLGLPQLTTVLLIKNISATASTIPQIPYMCVWSPAITSKMISIPYKWLVLLRRGSYLLMCLNTHLQQFPRTPSETISIQWPSSTIAGECSHCVTISRTPYNQPYGWQWCQYLPLMQIYTRKWSSTPAAALLIPDDSRLQDEFTPMMILLTLKSHSFGTSSKNFILPWMKFVFISDIPSVFFSRGQIFNALFFQCIFFQMTFNFQSFKWT